MLFTKGETRNYPDMLCQNQNKLISQPLEHLKVHQYQFYQEKRSSGKFFKGFGSTIQSSIY